MGTTSEILMIEKAFTRIRRKVFIGWDAIASESRRMDPAWNWGTFRTLRVGARINL